MSEGGEPFGSVDEEIPQTPDEVQKILDQYRASQLETTPLFTEQGGFGGAEKEITEPGADEKLAQQQQQEREQNLQALRQNILSSLSGYKESALTTSEGMKLNTDANGNVDILDASGKSLLDQFQESTVEGAISKSEFAAVITEVATNGIAMLDCSVDGVVKYKTIYELAPDNQIKVSYFEIEQPAVPEETSGGGSEPSEDGISLAQVKEPKIVSVPEFFMAVQSEGQAKFALANSEALGAGTSSEPQTAQEPATESEDILESLKPENIIETGGITLVEEAEGVDQSEQSNQPEQFEQSKELDQPKQFDLRTEPEQSVQFEQPDQTEQYDQPEQPIRAEQTEQTEEPIQIKTTAPVLKQEPRNTEKPTDEMHEKTEQSKQPTKEEPVTVRSAVKSPPILKIARLGGKLEVIRVPTKGKSETSPDNVSKLSQEATPKTSTEAPTGKNTQKSHEQTPHFQTLEFNGKQFKIEPETQAIKIEPAKPTIAVPRVLLNKLNETSSVMYSKFNPSQALFAEMLPVIEDVIYIDDPDLASNFDPAMLNAALNSLATEKRQQKKPEKSEEQQQAEQREIRLKQEEEEALEEAQAAKAAAATAAAAMSAEKNRGSEDKDKLKIDRSPSGPQSGLNLIRTPRRSTLERSPAAQLKQMREAAQILSEWRTIRRSEQNAEQSHGGANQGSTANEQQDDNQQVPVIPDNAKVAA